MREKTIFVIKSSYSENGRRDKVSALNFQYTFQFKCVIAIIKQ